MEHSHRRETVGDFRKGWSQTPMSLSDVWSLSWCYWLAMPDGIMAKDEVYGMAIQILWNLRTQQWVFAKAEIWISVTRIRVTSPVSHLSSTSVQQRRLRNRRYDDKFSSYSIKDNTDALVPIFFERRTMIAIMTVLAIINDWWQDTYHRPSISLSWSYCIEKSNNRLTIFSNCGILKKFSDSFMKRIKRIFWFITLAFLLLFLFFNWAVKVCNRNNDRPFLYFLQWVHYGIERN